MEQLAVGVAQVAHREVLRAAGRAYSFFSLFVAVAVVLVFISLTSYHDIDTCVVILLFITYHSIVCFRPQGGIHGPSAKPGTWISEGSTQADPQYLSRGGIPKSIGDVP